MLSMWRRPELGRLRSQLTQALVLTALCLAGCGGGNASGSEPAAPAAAGPSLVPAVQAAVVSQVGTTNTPAPALVVTVDDAEALGPFASWADAKRDYGAVGDGIVDDTAALQKALDDLGWKKPVVYLPAGKYRITGSLKLNGSPVPGGFWHGGVGLVGESADTTHIVWAGPAGDAMLIQNGGYNTRYSRITWDGKGTAGYGVAHWWSAKASTMHGGSPEHTDEVFKDMKIGIMAGRLGANYGQLDSEGQVRRVRFINNSLAGVNTGSWNALNWWVWDSRFTDCGNGVSNIYTVSDNTTDVGAGGIHVYRSLFERSKVADFHIANTGFFSVQHNVSVGSKRFFQGDGMGNNNASIVIQGNRVIDTTEPAAIVNGNLGPLVLLDNEIRSAVGNTSAAVLLNDWIQKRDVVSIGNKYTVASPIKVVDSTDRKLTLDDTVVDRSAISAALPTLPATPARSTRQVYEVPSGASETMIQAIINLAAQSDSVNPVVHFAAGIYKVGRTLVVPARARIQLVGDGLLSQLQWTGPASGILFQIDGPSLATIRDLLLVAPNARAFSMTNMDQAGGRIVAMGSTLGVLTTAKMSKTQISLQANTGLNGLDLSNAGSVVVVGAGGLGPVNVRDGSRLFVSDTWYEGPFTSLFTVSSGEFTYLNGHMSPASHKGTSDLSQAAITLNQLDGKATVLSFSVDTGSIPSGTAVRIANERSTSKALLMAGSANAGRYIDRPGSAGTVRSLMNKGGEYAPLPTVNTDEAFLRNMLSQARGVVWETAPHAVPANATNLRIYRVNSAQSLGMIVSGN